MKTRFERIKERFDDTNDELVKVRNNAHKTIVLLNNIETNTQYIDELSAENADIWREVEILLNKIDELQ